MLDFLTSSLIGHDPPKIVRAAARRLNTNIPSDELYYINRLEELIMSRAKEGSVSSKMGKRAISDA